MSADTAARLYGVGIGPGDPEMITLKAFRLLTEAEIIFTPRARIKGSSLARSIVEGAGVGNKNFIEIEFPMITGKTALAGKWRAAAEVVKTRMSDCRTAVFITLGDPGIYSTWTYLQNALAETAPKIKTETVAGISTMNAAAAALNRSLVTGRQKLALIPMPEDPEQLRPVLELFDTVVVYKVSAKLCSLVKLLEELELLDRTSLVKRAGFEDQEICRSLNDVDAETEAYLSTAVIRCGKEEEE